MERRKIKKRIAIVFIILCLLGGIWFYQKAWKEERSRLAREQEAKEGYLPGMTNEEIQEMMDKKVEEGSLSISINSVLAFESGTARGYVRIENSPKNHYLLVVEMYRKDNGERIYRSGAMEPGYYLEKDRLEGNLKKGDYPVKIHFKAYDRKSEEYIGQSVVENTVHILT